MFSTARLLVPLWLFSATALHAADAALVERARAVLRQHCYRCHGEAARGGFDYALDRDKLVAHKKIVPGQPAASELYQRLLKGDMPPPGKSPRPSASDVAVLAEWIAAGAPALPAPPRPFLTTAALYHLMAEDLRTIPEQQRRFIRYLTFTHLSNAGRPEAELRACGHALARVINSLSWHPRISRPKTVGPLGTVHRIDLRDYRWTARTWDRLAAACPYRGPASTDEDARFCVAATGSEDFHLRGDWFVANAARGKLYYDVLDLPATVRGLERLLQVDVTRDLHAATAARAGFNGSGVSKNNRVLQRHDAARGAYWRSYDFSDNVGRQNIFQCPLGPAAGRISFRPAGGEVIFDLPNGLHGYMLANADGRRVEKAPIDIVSDPRRPDRQVEVGLSCLSCHARGLLPKDDQVRAHVEKNPTAFTPEDTRAVKALYLPPDRMRALVDRDNKRFLKALEGAGIAAGDAEAVVTVTRRFENTVDLRAAAAEVGVPVAVLLGRLDRLPALQRALGPLRARGGTIQRQVFEEAFPRLLRELSLAAAGEATPRVAAVEAFTGHTDAVTCLALSADGRCALSGSQDNTLRLWDVRTGKQLRCFEGHTGTVRCVALSADGRRALSGGDDRTVRLWDVKGGKALIRLTGHADRVRGVAFAPDGHRALSAADDRTVRLWDLDGGKELLAFSGHTGPVNCVCLSPDGRRALSGGTDGTVRLWDAATGRELATWQGHPRGVCAVAFSPDGRRAASGGGDRVARLWDATTGKELRILQGSTGAVVAVAFSADGRQLLSASSQTEEQDAFLRVWNVDDGKEVARLGGTSRIWCVAFAADGTLALSGGTGKALRLWTLPAKR